MAVKPSDKTYTEYITELTAGLHTLAINLEIESDMITARGHSKNFNAINRAIGNKTVKLMAVVAEHNGLKDIHAI